VRRSLLLALAVLAASCTGGTPDPRTRDTGAESFVSQPPGGTAMDPRAGGPTAAGGPAGPGAPDAPSPTGTPRSVEEADVYALAGPLLHVLNGYRGLQLVDLSDLDAPALRGAVQVTGRPVDLYVRGGVAFFAVSDCAAWYWAADGGAARPGAGSQLWAVDVSRPAAPEVLARLDLEGSVTDTRLVGDVLYVVSRRDAWQDAMPLAGAAPAGPAGDLAYVASFDLSDPRAPRAVARVDFPAAGWESHAHVTDRRITLAQSGWDASGPVTRLTAVDIADPSGALAVGATFDAAGRVADRWGLDHDEGTGVSRAVLQNGWNGGATLRTWSSPTPATAVPLGRLDIVLPETLTAARFDGSRVYAVTAERVDPLWVIDAGDPAAPRLAGQLHMPGQIEFLEPRGTRLVALGHTDEAGQPFQLAVSLLDVADPAAPALLSRVLVGGGVGWVSASPDDLRKAFQVLDAQGLVLVPFQGWDASGWSWTGGVQLVDLDLAGGALAKRGFAAHRGAITRAFPAPGRAAWIATLSDERLQLVDATDRDAPVERSGLDLARPVAELAFVGGYGVELSGDWWRGDTSLVVVPPLDPDAAVPLARVDVPAPQARLFVDGSVAWLLAHDWSQGDGWLEAVDLADPLRPARRGRLEVPSADAVGLPGWGFWGGGSEAVLLGHVLAVHRAGWGPLPLAGGAPAAGSSTPVGGGAAGEVVLYDLSDPDAPRRAGAVALAGASWSWGLRADGGLLWLTHHEWVSDRWEEGVRYYLDRIDVSDPDAPRLLPKVNVPGLFLASSAGGTRVYTVEPVWDGAGAEPLTRFHALDLTPRGTARLAATVTVPGWAAGAVTGGSLAYALTDEWTAGGSRQRLVAVDLAAMALGSSQDLAATWSWPLRAAGGKLFLAAGAQSGQTILVYGLDAPGRPAFERSVPTRGWAWDVVVEGSVAYLPLGPYGVAMIPLAP
jgi:hypothetical protein